MEGLEILEFMLNEGNVGSCLLYKGCTSTLYNISSSLTLCHLVIHICTRTSQKEYIFIWEV